MSTKVKLSEAQRKLLDKLVQGPQYCVDYYSPAKRLVQLGLAERKKGQLMITSAGIEWVRSES